ncbi:short-chain dehydrogenase/reductase SDR [Hyaloraphidium curvatum]|nr:short-chain dehydrogenase/reductase SDR [Hyaloraphidium curvatum]
MRKYASAFRPGLMDGHVVLVTGGGTGIGRTIAHELASLGATVVVAARRLEQLQKTQNEIRALGGKCDAVQLNLKEDESCQAAVKTVIERHGKITGLVNNAGGQFTAPAEKINAKGFKTVVELNLVGTYQMIKAAFHLYMKDHGGSIVNILANYEAGYVWYSHTAAARSGVANLSFSLAQEWAPYGIRINNVVPGVILGGGIVSGHYPKEVIESMFGMETTIPAGRFGTESEIAAAVTFLLSPVAGYINGAVLKVDGGYAFRQPVNKVFGDLEVREPKIPAFTGWGESDEDVDAMGFAPVFAEKFKQYMRIGKGDKGTSKL